MILLLVISSKQLSEQDNSINPINSIKKVYNSYLVLKNALTIDNGDGAKISAKLLFASISKVPAKKLSQEQY